jgi:hypothetical protein
VRPAAAGALAVLLLVACGQGPTGSVASTSRTGGSPATASQSNTTAPVSGAMSTKLNCGDSHIGATALATYRIAMPSPSVEMLDVSDPLKPYLACTLSPAYGARFLSSTKLAFWIGDQLGMADLSSGAVTQTARLAASAGTGAFSPDGTKFAYRTFDDAGAMRTHLYFNGSDRTLYVQEPIGGHGGPGPSFGPFDQLEFSPDGSLLLDYGLFRPPSGPANLIVFRVDGSIAFQTTTAPGGTWSPTGNTLFFYASNQSGQSGELDRLDANGQRQVLASGLQRAFWLRMSPDGHSIIYNSSDNSVPDCGGVPHLWRIDIATGGATQISKAISSGPVFVQPTVIWTDEQQTSPCGPGGPSTEDGVILAHELNTGLDATVDTSLIPAGTGGPLVTWNLLDVWFVPS